MEGELEDESREDSKFVGLAEGIFEEEASDRLAASRHIDRHLVVLLVISLDKQLVKFALILLAV